MESLALSIDLAFRIKSQTDVWGQNKGKLRQLSLQAVTLSNDIREQFAGVDSAILVSSAFNDALSRLELTLSKILRAVEKEQNRGAVKRWLNANTSAGVCAQLSDELASCARNFNIVAHMHVYSQTRVISMQHEAMAARQEDLINAIHGLINNTQSPTPMIMQTDQANLVQACSESQTSNEKIVNWNDTSDPEDNFEAFIACLDLTLAPDSELSSSLHDALAFFIRHVSSCHSGTSICYAATESFVVEHGDEPKLLGCVAVLRPQYDLCPNFNDRAGNLLRCKNDVIFDFSLRDIAPALGPSDWIQVQVLADLFKDERVCFALWDLGRLPPASHLPDSDSFRWLKQSLSTVMTNRGPRNVVDIASGDPNQPFRRFHQLNARIAHPSNAAHRVSLVAHMDQEIRTVCEETWQEWYICLIGQLILNPKREVYLDAHYKYARRSMELEIEAFIDMGHLKPLSPDPNCERLAFEQLREDAFQAIDDLIRPLKELCSSGRKVAGLNATLKQLQRARVIGTAWWKIHTSIVLLSPAERERSSEYTRVPLGEARQELAKIQPALIWNYLPPHLASRARHKRIQLTNPPP